MPLPIKPPVPFQPAPRQASIPSVPAPFSRASKPTLQTKAGPLASVPLPALPAPFRPQLPSPAPVLAKRSSVLQRASQPQLPNAVAYTSLSLHYSAEELAKASAETGNDTGYSGHRSGKPGDAISSATTKIAKEIGDRARENRAKEKADKKKGPIRQEEAKSARWKAFQKAMNLMDAALKEPVSAVKTRISHLEAREQELETYLDDHTGPTGLDAQDVEECKVYWYEMLGNYDNAVVKDFNDFL